MPRRRIREESGATLVEFAFVLPVMLFLFVGIIDFAFLFQRYQVVTNAAREGARVAVLPGYSASDVQARVNDYIAAGLGASAPTGSTAVSPCATATSFAGAPQINVVTVTVTQTDSFRFLAPIATLVGSTGSFGSVTVTGTSTMRVEDDPGITICGP